MFDRAVNSLEFSVRTENVLKNGKIEYIGQLVQHSEAQILKMPNAGRKSLVEIREVLAGLGLELGVKLIDWNLPSTKAALGT